MGSRLSLAVLSMLVAGSVMAASAAAHQLEVQRASKANRAFAKSLCAATNEEPEARCVSSSPGKCNRISAHRVRCAVYITLEADDKSQGRCLTLIEWFIRGKSPALQANFLGVRSCQQVKPPETPPAP
jgi:hypothetical protein